MGLEGHLAQKESEDRLDCQDFQERQESQVSQETTDQPDPGGRQAATAPREREGLQGAVVSVVKRDVQVPLVCQDLRETPAT